MSKVQEGDTILELEITDSVIKTYQVKANKSGLFFKFPLSDTKSLSIDDIYTMDIHRVPIGGIYRTKKEFAQSLYKNKTTIEIDHFNNEKYISCEYVCKPTMEELPHTIFYNFNTLKHQTIKINPYISIVLIYEKGKGYIEFEYCKKMINIKKGDSISFLSDNNHVLDFVVTNKPYKKSEKSIYQYFKCQLYIEDIDFFLNEKITEWKISFNSDDRPTLHNKIDCKENMFTSLLLRYFVTDYINLVHQEVPEYRFPHKSLVSESTKGTYQFDWCYVYLMKDLANGYYKIGISNKPEYRERTLQSEKPSIELLCAKKFPSRQIAESIESALHSTFGNKRIRGEWFMLDEFDVATLCETLK